MRRHFLLRHTLARLLLRAARWRAVGDCPRRGILVGAPHTSNWDWVLTMLLAWTNDVQISLLVKNGEVKHKIQGAVPYAKFKAEVESHL